MACNGDPGSHIKVTRFIKFCHVTSTRASRAGCPLMLLAAGGCAGPYSALEPGGPAAADISLLWWVMLAGALLILGGVTATALYAFRHNRIRHELSEKKVLIGWGLIFPFVVLGLLMIFAFATGESLLSRGDTAKPVYRAHASQWFWTFGYPDGKVGTGVLHVRVGETFHVEVTSEDVIHSFWVPRLGGKIDAIPGRVNRIALKADAPGRYHGLCAEYCGVGHALMPFVVEAHPAGAYTTALLEAEGMQGNDAFPLQERPAAAAGEAVRKIIDYVLRWVGVKE